MPYANVKIAKNGATKEQKAKIIKGITTLLFDVLGKKPSSTYVVIEEIDTDNWGVGGESLTEIRKRNN